MGYFVNVIVYRRCPSATRAVILKSFVWTGPEIHVFVCLTNGMGCDRAVELSIQLQLQMLLFPNALCCSLYEPNCVCAVTKIFTKFLPANNLCQLLRVTRKRSCTSAGNAQAQLHFRDDQQRAFGISNISNWFKIWDRVNFECIKCKTELKWWGICDVIKQYESELANTASKIQSNKADSFFCFLMFVQSFNCLYHWNQLPNLCGVFTKLKPKQYSNRKWKKKKKKKKSSFSSSDSCCLIAPHLILLLIWWIGWMICIFLVSSTKLSNSKAVIKKIYILYQPVLII